MIETIAAINLVVILAITGAVGLGARYDKAIAGLTTFIITFGLSAFCWILFVVIHFLAKVW